MMIGNRLTVGGELIAIGGRENARRHRQHKALPNGLGARGHDSRGEGRPIGFGSALLSDRLPGLPDSSFSRIVFDIRAIMVFSMNQLSVVLPSAAVAIAFIVGGVRFLIKKYVEKLSMLRLSVVWRICGVTFE
ncbi:hypothetical protein P0F65_05195 [Sphingomonas sp. I4]